MISAFLGGVSGKEPTCQSWRHKRWGLGRSPGGGHGNPLRYSCLENPMDRGTWWATVHGVAKSQARLKDLTHTHILWSHLKITTVSFEHEYFLFPRLPTCLAFCWLPLNPYGSGRGVLNVGYQPASYWAGSPGPQTPILADTWAAFGTLNQLFNLDLSFPLRQWAKCLTLGRQSFCLGHYLLCKRRPSTGSY